jgi:hypothetical protein
LYRRSAGVKAAAEPWSGAAQLQLLAEDLAYLNEEWVPGAEDEEAEEEEEQSWLFGFKQYERGSKDGGGMSGLRARTQGRLGWPCAVSVER